MQSKTIIKEVIPEGLSLKVQELSNEIFDLHTKYAELDKENEFHKELCKELDGKLTMEKRKNADFQIHIDAMHKDLISIERKYRELLAKQ